MQRSLQLDYGPESLSWHTAIFCYWSVLGNRSKQENVGLYLWIPVLHLNVSEEMTVEVVGIAKAAHGQVFRAWDAYELKVPFFIHQWLPVSKDCSVRRRLCLWWNKKYLERWVVYKNQHGICWNCFWNPIPCHESIVVAECTVIVLPAFKSLLSATGACSICKREHALT